MVVGLPPAGAVQGLAFIRPESSRFLAYSTDRGTEGAMGGLKGPLRGVLRAFKLERCFSQLDGNKDVFSIFENKMKSEPEVRHSLPCS